MTISRFTGGNHISSISGSTPEEMLPYLADAVVRQYSWQIMFTVGQGMGTLRPLILVEPDHRAHDRRLGLEQAAS